MTGSLAQIWRHPIKAHGAEPLNAATIPPGGTLPWDRVWAVAHEAARLEGDGWARCANFSRGAKAPQLMAITVTLDESSERVTLSHPDRPNLTVHPDDPDDAVQMLQWLRPLMPEDRAQSDRIVRIRDRGMTDSDFPSISLIGNASLALLAEKVGRRLDQRRFRANFWMDGTEPFEEFDWVGHKIRVGTAEFGVRERIERCMATTVDPNTGKRDTDILATLKDEFGHQDFGVFLVATKGGDVALGDAIEVI